MHRGLCMIDGLRRKHIRLPSRLERTNLVVEAQLMHLRISSKRVWA